MWIIYQIVSMGLVCVSRAYLRVNGLCWKSIFVHSLVAVVFTSWMLALSYKEAPSFFQPYFLSLVAMSVFGFIFSLWFFGDKITFINIVGVGFSLIGATLIGIK